MGSANVNKVILVGNLGTDPVLRQTANGHSVANLSVATNRVYKLADGTTKENTVWHRVVVWGKTAENCHKYLGKGNKVYLEGTLQTHSWKDKDGQQRWKTEVLCDDIQFLGSRPFAGTESAEPDIVSALDPDEFVAPTESLQ